LVKRQFEEVERQLEVLEWLNIITGWQT